jgi:hypothetical protein
MEKIHFAILFSVLFLFACSKSQPETKTQSEVSRFHNLELKAGMKREKVEVQVATLLSKPNSYSPYENNLQGGIVKYHDGEWVLEIKYKAGAPAPTIINKEGKAQGYPPIDETIIEFKIEKIPNNSNLGD